MGFPGGARAKYLPVNAGYMWIQSLGQEDPLEKGMATHSSILAWRIPWTEVPGRLQSMGSQSRTQLKQLNTHTHTRNGIQSRISLTKYFLKDYTWLKNKGSTITTKWEKQSHWTGNVTVQRSWIYSYLWSSCGQVLRNNEEILAYHQTFNVKFLGHSSDLFSKWNKMLCLVDGRVVIWIYLQHLKNLLWDLRLVP